MGYLFCLLYAFSHFILFAIYAQTADNTDIQQLAWQTKLREISQPLRLSNAHTVLQNESQIKPIIANHSLKYESSANQIQCMLHIQLLESLNVPLLFQIIHPWEMVTFQTFQTYAKYNRKEGMVIQIATVKFFSVFSFLFLFLFIFLFCAQCMRISGFFHGCGNNFRFRTNKKKHKK